MHRLVLFYKIFNALSLDVVLGAMASAVFFSHLLRVIILPYGLAALGLTVWIIYTVDHLHDAKKITTDASSFRHRMHQQNFRLLTFTVYVAGVVVCILLFYIRKPVFYWGLALAIIVACYLFLQQRPGATKEFIVATVYTLGILLPSLAVTVEPITLPMLLLFVQFFFVALLNLLLFSLFDVDSDRRDGLTSFATQVGTKQCARVITILFTLQLLLSVTSLAHREYRLYSGVLLCMTIVLLMIFMMRERMHRHDLYRVLGDAVFILPALLIFWHDGAQQL